jgi:hypothetical protein
MAISDQIRERAKRGISPEIDAAIYYREGFLDAVMLRPIRKNGGHHYGAGYTQARMTLADAINKHLAGQGLEAIGPETVINLGLIRNE